jgi:hypothetical protein
LSKFPQLHFWLSLYGVQMSAVANEFTYDYDFENLLYS